MPKFIELKNATTGKMCLINVEKIEYVYPALSQGRVFTSVKIDGRDLLFDETYEDVREAIFDASRTK